MVKPLKSSPKYNTPDTRQLKQKCETSKVMASFKLKIVHMNTAVPYKAIKFKLVQLHTNVILYIETRIIILVHHLYCEFLKETLT